MEPVYLDLHIHTSKDPNNIKEKYDLDMLIEKVKGKAQGESFLISFTDHNVINERVYMEAVKVIKDHLILGVELHIQTHKDNSNKAYHCHMYFNLDGGSITSEVIGDINSKLDLLYPNKLPELKDPNIPLIQRIIEGFDEYDFILLPHGGQSHATFDSAMPDGKQFNNVMQRSVYYNFFDGFTSRSCIGTEKTNKYLEGLGLKEFINLVTGSDNYKPSDYPESKNKEANAFMPTWMYATPTFAGLRLSLSDSSRLEYGQKKPKTWRDSIKKIKLKNDKIDIDIDLTPGLNVIIGESSSGKSLLVDSLCRKLNKSDFNDSKYKEYKVEDIQIIYPESLNPYFIEQNFITKIIGENKEINNIEIIKRILPDNSNSRKEINKGLNALKESFTSLFKAVEKIEDLEAKIERIPVLSTLIVVGKVEDNILEVFLKKSNLSEDFKYEDFRFKQDSKFLDDLDKRLRNNPFVNEKSEIIQELKEEIREMYNYSILEKKVKDIIVSKKNEIDKELKEKDGEIQNKKQDFSLLIGKMKEYYRCLQEFEKSLDEIANYSIKTISEKKEIEGYILSIENKFELNKEIIKFQLNNLLLKSCEIDFFEDITPDKLFKKNFKSNIKGVTERSGLTYEIIVDSIFFNLKESDVIKYKIQTPEEKDFDKQSPGLKTAIILELILNFKDDDAPLVIDQPEDNLATSYMNDGLVKSIKKIKSKKQIIFVSHNATIPMSGDAQNIILCRNNSGKILIRSNPLEGKIDNIDVVDYIAKIADGGKSSVKKRFKKYNLKKIK